MNGKPLSEFHIELNLDMYLKMYEKRTNLKSEKSIELVASYLGSQSPCFLVECFFIL